MENIAENIEHIVWFSIMEDIGNSIGRNINYGTWYIVSETWDDITDNIRINIQNNIYESIQYNIYESI